MEFEISGELQDLVQNSNIQQVYFTKDGNHHLSVHQVGDKLYASGANATFSAGHSHDADNSKYEIVGSLTREEILEEEKEAEGVAHTFSATNQEPVTDEDDDEDKDPDETETI